MQNDIVYGVEMIEFGIPQADGSLPTSWTRFENIEDGSVSITSNQDTKTNIIPEDKDVPILVLYTPGDPDVFNFALLEISAINLQTLFNVVYDPTTTKVTVLSKRRHANLAIRLTTRPQFGVKKIFVYPNCMCEATYKNNVTKNALLAIAVAASVLSYKLDDDRDASYTVQKVNEDGTPINSVPTYDTTLDFTSAVSDTAAGVTGTIAAISSVVKLKFNAITSPTGTPANMVVKVAGTEVMSVDFPSDYLGKGFSYTDASAAVHYGNFAAGDVAV
jgi:hypothetical protein